MHLASINQLERELRSIEARVYVAGHQVLDSERMLNKILSAIGQPRWEPETQACTNRPDGERHCSDCVHYVDKGCRLGLPDAVDELFASECSYFTREDEA